MAMYKKIAVHGRFQPPLHINHWNYISKAFDMAEKVLILITNPFLEETSVIEALHRNKRENNPFTYEQRVTIFTSFFNAVGISKDRYEFHPFDITKDSEWAKLEKTYPYLVNVYSDWSEAKFIKFKSKGFKTVRLDMPKSVNISGTQIRELIFNKDDPETKKNNLIRSGYMKEAIPVLFKVMGF